MDHAGDKQVWASFSTLADRITGEVQPDWRQKRNDDGGAVSA